MRKDRIKKKYIRRSAKIIRIGEKLRGEPAVIWTCYEERRGLFGEKDVENGSAKTEKRKTLQEVDE